MKILIFILFGFILFSCNAEEAIDERKCLSNIVDVFPRGKIFYNGLPDSKYEFVVIDSNNVFFVETKSIRSAKITSIILLKEIK